MSLCLSGNKIMGLVLLSMAFSNFSSTMHIVDDFENSNSHIESGSSLFDESPAHVK